MLVFGSWMVTGKVDSLITANIQMCHLIFEPWKFFPANFRLNPFYYTIFLQNLIFVGQ